MTTADWALLISCGSALTALAGFIWNVWSKFIYPKPRVQTHIALWQVIEPGVGGGVHAIGMSATNHGPVPVTLKVPVAISKLTRMPFYKSKHGLLIPYDNFPHGETAAGPFGGGLPKKLDVGEAQTSYFKPSINWFENGFTRFGFADTFGRTHWASKKACEKLRKDLEKLDLGEGADEI